MVQCTLDEVVSASRKNDGLDCVECSNGEFVRRMRECAVQVSLKTGAVCADDLRVMASELKIQPKHPNAWGAIFRGQRWQMIGRRKSEFVSNHAREIKCWVYRGAF